ncbi:hypothetical protein DPMN_122041 [Dreissena polymorpha]|uniref:Uncharacterized protein n=1 Tax=Dreissena polymorpha TaxID=45954 RepID=A0A9D4JQ12_DREPO|nr:hypothetical protein DPMN_122041 [Dreissena polymorpha]
MIICGRSQNTFLPSCCALGQERIFRAPADDHALENVYYPYINFNYFSGGSKLHNTINNDHNNSIISCNNNNSINIICNNKSYNNSSNKNNNSFISDNSSTYYEINKSV